MDLAVGTGVMLVEEGDAVNPVKFSAIPLPHVCLANGPTNKIDSVYRKRSCKLNEIKVMYPKAEIPNEVMESMDENKGFLEALIQTTNRVTANVDSVIDISEPYNGYVRGLSVTAFLAPLLAEMGENAYSHGVESVGPKFGLTHHKVLKSIGIAGKTVIENSLEFVCNASEETKMRPLLF